MTRGASEGGRLLLRGVAGLLLLGLAIRFAVPEQARNLESLAAAWTAPMSSVLGWFAIAFGCFGANFAAGAARFAGLLRGAGLRAGYASLFRAYLVASFANVILPGGLGDVYRFVDARRDTGRGGEVLGIVVLERLLSLAALGGIVLLAVPFLPPLGALPRGWLLAVAAVFVLAPLCPLHPAGRALLRYALPPLQAVSVRAAGACERALEAVEDVSEQPRVLLRALLLSLLMHALPVAAVGALAVPLDADVPWVWFALIVPVVTLLALIPVSVAGIGVREYLYIALFGAVGMRAEVALSLSLSTFAVTLAWAGIGLALFTSGRGAQPPEDLGT